MLSTTVGIGKSIIRLNLNHLLISRERYEEALLSAEDVCLLFVDRGFRRSQLNGLLTDDQRFVKTLETCQTPCLSNIEILIIGIQSKRFFISLSARRSLSQSISHL
jgi:hypothetical protein